MTFTQYLKVIPFVLLTCGSVEISRGQVGIVAGQTAGMQLRYPTNATFRCTFQTSLQCNSLDADGDGTDDFSLICDAGGIYTIQMTSLQPAVWEVLRYNTTANGYTMPVPLGNAIGPVSGSSAWAVNTGYLRNAGPGGQSQNATTSGNWPEDTLTRIIGIRQLRNGQWCYGYLKTRYMIPNFGSRLQVTMCAIQSVVTNTKASQLTQIEMYPNPAQCLLQIKLPYAAQLLVYDAVGRLHHEEQVAAGTARLAISNWSEGIYLLRLENEFGVYTHRFQKTE